MAIVGLKTRPGMGKFQEYWDALCRSVPENRPFHTKQIRQLMRDVSPSVSSSSMTVYVSAFLATGTERELLTKLGRGCYVRGQCMEQPAETPEKPLRAPPKPGRAVAAPRKAALRAPPHAVHRPNGTVMRPTTRWQMQTEFFSPESPRSGNCVQACVASILNRDMRSVPNFVSLHGGQWFPALRNWLYEVGFDLLSVPSTYTFTGFYLVVGTSPRDVRHMVVYRDGVVHWDPHPDQSGLTTPDSLYILLPHDPSQVVRGAPVLTGEEEV